MIFYKNIEKALAFKDKLLEYHSFAHLKRPLISEPFFKDAGINILDSLFEDFCNVVCISRKLA